jgi:hypothetical protein
MLHFEVNLAREPVVGIQCTTSYVDKTSHTYSLNSFHELTSVGERVWYVLESGEQQKETNDVWRGSVEPFKSKLGNTWVGGDNVENTSNHWESWSQLGSSGVWSRTLKKDESSSLETHEEISGPVGRWIGHWKNRCISTIHYVSKYQGCQTTVTGGWKKRRGWSPSHEWIGGEMSFDLDRYLRGYVRKFRV